MLSPNERKALNDYLRQQQKIAGRQRIGGSDALRRAGLTSDQIAGLGKTPKTPSVEPKGIGKVLETVFRPIGFYTRHVSPGFAEWLSPGVIEPSIEARYGKLAADDYRAERAKFATEQAARVSERGWLSSLGDFFRGMSEVRKNRPKLFWAEKLLGEVLLDPITYMGFGLATRIPIAGKILGPIMDTLPNKAWWYTFGLPARAIRAGLEAMPPEKVATTLWFALTPAAKATLEADRVAGAFRYLFGQSAINANSPASTRALLDMLGQLRVSGLDITDEAVGTALQGLNNARLYSNGFLTSKATEEVRRSLGALEGIEELAKSRAQAFMSVPEDLAEDWLGKLTDMHPQEFIQEIRKFSEDSVIARYDDATRAAAEGREWLSGIAAKMRNTKMATWFQNKISRWVVMEPARAVLAFANLGNYNYVEDFGSIWLSGTRPTHLDFPTFQAIASSRAIPKMFEESFGITEAARAVGLTPQVPALLRVPLVEQVTWPAVWTNTQALKGTAALRRGSLLERYAEQMRKGLIENTGFFQKSVDRTPTVFSDGYRMLHTEVPGVFDKGLRKSATIANKLLYQQGDIAGLENIVDTVFAKRNLDLGMVDELSKQFLGSGSPQLRELVYNQARDLGHAGFIGANLDDLKSRAVEAMVGQVKVEPKVVGDRMAALLRNAKELTEAGDNPVAIVDAIREATARLGSWSAYSKTIVDAAASSAQLGKYEHWGWMTQKQVEITKTVNAQLIELRSIVKASQAKVSGLAPFAEGITKTIDDFDKVFAQYRVEEDAIFASFFKGEAKGLSRLWATEVQGIANGGSTSGLPRAWQQALSEGEWLQTRLRNVANAKDKRELANDIISQGWRAFFTERSRVGQAYRSQFDLGKEMRLRANDATVFTESLLSPEAAAISREAARRIDEASKAIVTGKEAVETSVYQLLDVEFNTAVEQIERGLRSGAISEEQLSALRAYFKASADQLRKLSPEELALVVKNSDTAWDESIEWFRNTLTNYDHATQFDDMMRMINPFWIYQSRSYPRLFGAMVKRPLLGTMMAPGGRYWQETDEGYVPTPLPGFEASPIRGTILGRLRRMQRSTFPPRYSGALGSFEHIEDTMEQYGFFPGLHVTIPIELGLSLIGGGTSKDTLATVIESLPAGYATTVDGLVAASRVLGPKATGILADSLFPSKFRDYYVTKALWDSHKVSVAQAEELGHQDWIADAQARVALGQMMEEQVSLTRFNPEAWKDIQEARAKMTAEITGVSPEEQKRITMSGKRLTEVLTLSRIDKAKLATLEGLESLSEASTVMSPEDRRAYMEALHDFYNGLEAIRTANYDDQLADDGHLAAGELDPKVWRANYHDRMTEYRALADSSAEFRYFSKIGKTPVERQAIRERYGFAPKFVHPVDVVLDSIFAMEPDVDAAGEADFLGLFVAQDAIIGALPEDMREEVKGFLNSSATPLVREFREGRLFMKPYWQAEKEVPKWYRASGYDEEANVFEAASRALRRMKLEEQEEFAKGRVPTSVDKILSYEAYLRRHIVEYQWRLVSDHGMPGYDTRITEYIRKFYGQKGPQ